MMTRTGKALRAALVLLLLQASPGVWAVVEASVDRTEAALGDTLQLVISASEDDEDLGSADLALLQDDFQVLSRSTRSNTSIVNGQRSHQRQLQLEITPLRTGVLEIPAFTIGSKRTAPIQIRVTDAPKLDPGQQTVLFEAEVDRDSVYVQGQVLLTVRLQQAINLDDQRITELEVPGAFVVPLEQKSFQRQVNGRPWLVYEVRYALFPEQSGAMEIPALRFTARESVRRRSLFDSTRGRVVRLNSEPIRIEVKPRPAAFTGDSWLPARNLVVEEEWSADPDALQVGASVTRTVRLRAEGVQGAQLPPVLFQPVAGIKHYPDQPAISDSEISSGLLGSRSDSVAIVPTRAGRIELPAVEIPWWDTDAEVMRTAVIPARTLDVSAAAPETSAPVGPTAPALNPGASTPAPAAGSNLLWQALTLVCALGWAVTTFLLLRRRVAGTEATATAVANSARREYKSLLATCASDQPAAARSALINWAAALADDPAITSLQAAVKALDSDELAAEAERLERALYGSDAQAWQGQRLRAIVEHLHARRNKDRPEQEARLRLYPTG